MRCKNCGWENAEGAGRCVKCNAPLSGSMAVDSNRQIHQMEDAELRKTIRETGNEEQSEETQESGVFVCPRCNYPVTKGMNVCPQCGEQLVKKEGYKRESKNNCRKCGQPLPSCIKFCPNCGNPVRMGTIDPWTHPASGAFCTLRPIPWNNEHAEYQPISFSGDVVILNRNNTDPNNNSITSAEQAALIYEGNGWSIEDRSSLKSTYIRVKKRVKLEDGDIIVLGNRLFEFKG